MSRCISCIKMGDMPAIAMLLVYQRVKTRQKWIHGIWVQVLFLGDVPGFSHFLGLNLSLRWLWFQPCKTAKIWIQGIFGTSKFLHPTDLQEGIWSEAWRGDHDRSLLDWFQPTGWVNPRDPKKRAGNNLPQNRGLFKITYHQKMEEIKHCKC